MNTADMTLKPGAEFSEEDVAVLANALRALAFHEALACDSEDEPEGLRHTVAQGLNVADKLFG